MAEHQATEEQLVYARLLDKGMKMGLLLIVITFALYVSGVLAPHTPISKLSHYWGMPVHDYMEKAGISPGWAWLGMLGRGDFANFIGIAFLAGVTVVCYIAILPVFLKKKDKVYFVLALIEAAVLIFAASGVLKAGGH